MLFKKKKLNENHYCKISESNAKRLFKNGETIYISNGEITSALSMRVDGLFPNVYGMDYYVPFSNKNCKDIIVTRHPNVERYFREHGLKNAPCVKDLRDYEYKNKHIYCASVPLKMAGFASEVTCLNLTNPIGINLDELSYKEFKQYVRNCTTFKIYSTEWKEGK